MTSFADSNRTGLKYVKETTWGTTPSGPLMKKFNFTSEGLKSNINTVTSESIRDDRNVSDVTKVGGGAGGDIGFELRYGDLDDLFEGAFANAWVTTVVSAALASAYFSGGVIESDSSALNDLLVGQFIRVANASTPANDGDYRITSTVTSVARTKVYLSDASSGSAAAFTTEVFSATTTLKGKNLRNGTTLKSYTIEKDFSDIGSAVHQFTGMRVANLSFDLATQAILTGSMTLMGKTQNASTTSLASATSNPSTNTVLNASGNVGKIWEGGQAVTGVSFQSISMEINNNAREQQVVGSDSLAGVALGRCEVTGSFTAYFENNSLLNKFTAGTASNLRFQVTDDTGNSYIIDVPKIRITDATVVAGGPNSDVVIDMNWAAMIDDNGIYAVQLDALDA
jgi:hypothetical protein